MSNSENSNDLNAASTDDKPAVRPAKSIVKARFQKTVISTILIAIIYCAASVLWVHQQEKRIVTTIKFARGQVRVGYCGPDWIPQWFREYCPIFDRVQEVSLSRKRLPARLFSELGLLSSLMKLRLYDSEAMDVEIRHLKGLTSLKLLDLSHSRISDIGLEHLKSLKNLKQLALGDTRVSDKGLLYLKEMTGLTSLDLQSTQTTEEGRASLRKALPNCDINPNS